MLLKFAIQFQRVDGIDKLYNFTISLQFDVKLMTGRKKLDDDYLACATRNYKLSFDLHDTNNNKLLSMIISLQIKIHWPLFCTWSMFDVDNEDTPF